MIRFSHVTAEAPCSRINLKHVSFHVPPGEIAFFTGVPGSGVSLLCDLCIGSVYPDDGKITIGGYDSSLRTERTRMARRLLIGAVSSRIPLIENRSVMDNVSLPLEIRGRSFGKAVRSTMNALHALGIVHIRRQRPAVLTTDERYRVSVARAIVSLPRIVIVDECDCGSQQSTLADYPDLLRTMSAWGAAVLIATHDYPEFHGIGARILSMEDGMIKNTVRVRPQSHLLSRSYLMDLLLKNQPSA